MTDASKSRRGELRAPHGRTAGDWTAMALGVKHSRRRAGYWCVSVWEKEFFLAAIHLLPFLVQVACDQKANDSADGHSSRSKTTWR